MFRAYIAVAQSCPEQIRLLNNILCPRGEIPYRKLDFFAALAELLTEKIIHLVELYSFFGQRRVSNSAALFEQTQQDMLRAYPCAAHLLGCFYAVIHSNICFFRKSLKFIHT